MAKPTCPHCKMSPCMGGRGPGSCMSGSKGKNVPTPRSEKEQQKDAPKTHTSNWGKVGSADTAMGKFDSFICSECGKMKLVNRGQEPKDETHENRKR